MADLTYWPAPAKLNLLLEVTGRNVDGYHRLQTVFQLLDWGDRLAFEITGSKHIERCTQVAGVSPEQDLCVRAAALLQQHCGLGKGVRIWLEKAIPLGGGLGGASSDAATTLLALNQLWGCGLDIDTLASLGLSLGADVPVFVRGQSAWAEGVGEQLQPLSLGTRHYVLFMPGLHASTADLFAQPQLQRNSEPRTPFVPPHQPAQREQLPNAFEPLVLDRFPQLGNWFSKLDPQLMPRMTGTGSSWFFAARDEKHANSLTTALKNLYNNAAVQIRAVRGLDQSPLLRCLQGADLQLNK